MPRVLTNNFGLRYVVETAIGTPGTTGWRILEPNSPATFGASITKVPRRPISPTRGRRKGATVDLDSAVEFEADLTLDSAVDFAEGFVFSEFANVEFDLKSSSGTLPPPAVGTTDDFTIDAASALLGGKMVYAATGARSLVYAKGYTNSANNGLHVLNADVASTDTTVQVASTLVTETPPTNASLQVAGIEIDTGDVSLAISGSTATLTSAAHVADWSTYGLRVGQYIHIGSDDGTGAVQNAFDDAGTDDNFGYARITAISSGVLSLDKLDANLTANDTNTGLLHVMFGRFLRNVATTADSDDTRYLERSYHFEGSFQDLSVASTTEYEYAAGNYANEWAINIPLAEKATASWGFIGTNSDDIVVSGSRKTGASSAVSPLRTTAINTSSDVASLTTDLVSAASDVCFKSLTVTIGNNVTPEKCIGTLGALFMNTGLFEVNLEGQMLFTNKTIITAIKNNTTTTFAAILKNEDGAFVLDIPALTFGGGDREFPVDQSVLVNVTGEAFNDPDGTIPDVSLGISLFPSVPTTRS
jgi:hypothetical protein